LTDAETAIREIHHLAQIEVAYDTALNLGRGMKQHTMNLERQRTLVFRLIVDRDPTPVEKERLVYGDA
jgi:hypothetical protein